MICIIDCGTSWLEEIKENVSDCGHAFEVITLDALQDSSVESYAGVIISGAPTMLSEVDHQSYLKPFQRLKETTLPVFGICLGHQILGLLFGSRIQRGEVINRQEQIEIVKQDAVFSRLQNPASFREDHSEFITLPKGFDLLAKSESCPNEAMKHQQKNIYSVQFHPEVSGDNGRMLIGNFLKLCSPVL